MNIMEQQIWDYLDGSCSEQERKSIAVLIETDPVYRSTYSELKVLHEELGVIDLDEPSMGFTRNVMERISAMPVAGSIKSLIDKRIIYGIAAFFLLSILVLLALVFSQVDWARPVTAALPLDLPRLDYTSYINSTYMQIFFLADIVLGLYILDTVLRKRMLSK